MTRAFRSLIDTVVLPTAVTAHEDAYLRRVNAIAHWFFAAHIPAFAVLAALNDTNPLLAIVLTSIVFVGPMLGVRALDNPRSVSIVYGITAMAMGGLLVHFGQGPLQIEMHFYFFALLAMLVIFANPMVIVAATITVAVHHLVVWLVVPSSVFNYEAPAWVVAVHAGFVVLEATATCFIARSFHDNVIGLERQVARRTAQLANRNQDMRTVLDTVDQGFVMINRKGGMAADRSSAFDAWFGRAPTDFTLFDLIDRFDDAFGARSRVAFEQVVDGLLPVELSLMQMPAELTTDGRTLCFAYRAIGKDETPDRFLVVVVDVTEERARIHAERRGRDTLRLLEHLIGDRGALASFLHEASELVDRVTTGELTDLAVVRRSLHTLKGNASVFGLEGLAEICHDLESRMIEVGEAPPSRQLAELRAHWQRLESDAARLTGQRASSVAVDAGDRQALLRAIESGESPQALVRRVRELELEPTRNRLEQFAEQVPRIAGRCNKPAPTVTVEHNGLRLDGDLWSPFWSAFVHALRNAIDHGIESADERRALGKPEAGHIRLATALVGERFVVTVEDDGRGVNWKAVASRAKTHGLATRDQSDLKAALFADGLSTAAELSMVSGRGVGMGAVHAAAELLDGTVEVWSECGRGTRLELSFPREKMSRLDSPRSRAA